MGAGQGGEKAGHLGRANSGKLAGVGLRRAWRLDCQVLGEPTPCAGPVSAARAGAACGEDLWRLSLTSKAVARDPSCQMVSGNIPATLLVAFKWFQRPHTQTAKN